jgi:hypothetical protein
MKTKISTLCNAFYKEVAEWDRAELETAIGEVNKYSATNCGWIEFHMAPGLRALFHNRLHDITPIFKSK